MRNLFILLVMLVISYGCNKKYDTITNECVGGSCIEDNNEDNDVTNNNGDTDDEDDNGDVVVNENSIAGYYNLPNGGYIEVVELNNGRYWIYQQLVLSQNNDGGLALHPNFSQGPHLPQGDGSLRYAQNLNYSPTNNDVERDGATSNLDGVYRTEIELRINDAGNFEYNVIVKNGTSVVSAIYVDRVIEEE